MANHNPCNAVDRALVAYLVSIGAGTAEDVWPAKRSQEKDVQPCTIVWSHSARPLKSGPFCGLWVTDAFIEIHSSAVVEENESPDEPKVKATDRFAATMDAFLSDVDSSSEALAIAITQAARSSGDSNPSQATIQSVEVVQIDQGFNSRSTSNTPSLLNTWLDTIHLEIVWSPTTINPH